MNQYLFLYEVNSYDGLSVVGMTFAAVNDEAAGSLAKVIWEKINKKSRFGYEQSPEFYCLTENRAVEIEFQPSR